jgi:hypothetical protein
VAGGSGLGGELPRMMRPWSESSSSCGKKNTLCAKCVQTDRCTDGVVTCACRRYLV